MNTIKYPIKEVNIKSIPGNRILGMGISRNQKELCRKSIKQFGLVMPIVTVEKQTGEMMVLKGDKELSVLKEMNVDKAEVFVANIKEPSDTGKVILLLSSMHNELNHISEGLILRELIKLGQYNQKQLAKQLMKSEAWISKRLSLVDRLNDNVATMVMDKTLCPTAAQIISRIPKDMQHTFAINVYSENIPKSVVEKLVCVYGNKNTPDVVRDTIIKDPVLAAGNIIVGMEKSSIVSEKSKYIGFDSQDSPKFQGTLRLMLKVVSELEAYLANFSEDNLLKYASLVAIVESTLTRFLVLLKNKVVSPGKSKAMSNGGEGNGCC